MKLLLIILLFLVTKLAGATNYYVANAAHGGSDGNTGLIGFPWATCAHVNAQTFNPGDTIFFNRGDVWNEMFIPPSSGTQAAQIVIDAYGSGALPNITGLTTLTLTDSSGPYWKVSFTKTGDPLLMVTVGGLPRTMARTPNSSWYNIAGYNSATQVVVGTLTGTPNYTGSYYVSRSAHWVEQRILITSQSGNTINLGSPLYADPLTFGANGFFVMNTFSDLDTANEWQYWGGVLRVYFPTGTPVVQASNKDTVVWIHKKNWLTFININISGGNTHDVLCDSSNHITIHHGDVQLGGAYGVTAVNSVGLHVYDDTIQNILSTAIYGLSGTLSGLVGTAFCDSAVADTNQLSNIGMLDGMGGNGDIQYEGIFIAGGHGGPLIRRNVFTNIGYNAITWFGWNSSIYENLFSYGCMQKDDGAFIYTTATDSVYAANTDSGSVVRRNMTFHGVGIGSSSSRGVTYVTDAASIYLDNDASYITADSNTSYDCETYSYYNNEIAHAIVSTWLHNTVMDSLGNAWHMNFGSGAIALQRNVFYQQNSSLPVIDPAVNSSSFLAIDTNIYLRPTAEPNKMKITVGGTPTVCNLGSAWTTASNWDPNSTGMPHGASGVGQLFYNPNTTDSTMSFGGPAVDAAGNYYQTGSVVVHPFESIILFSTADRTKINQKLYRSIH